MITNVTKEQVFKRWDALSSALREAITSEINSKLAWKTAQDEHLSE